ncbi:hypothetical protein [Muriicola sp.]|uniref:hypothetical protein n=1 Tax=Muriicola sp. TaxID=2020856 RepID=UPI00356822D6
MNKKQHAEERAGLVFAKGSAVRINAVNPELVLAGLYLPASRQVCKGERSQDQRS